MKTIHRDTVWTSKMFSRETWSYLRKKLGNISHYDEMALADGFTLFIQKWMEEHDFNFDVENPFKEKWTGSKRFQHFHDEYDGTEYRFEGNLYKALLDRWVDFLEND